MKLWSKGFEPDKLIEEFTVGRDRELDLRLAKYDVEGSMAHIRMLESIGLLEKEELTVLLAALEEIHATAERGEFVIEPPITLWSSAEINLFVSFAHFIIISSSIGFIVCISTTLT